MSQDSDVEGMGGLGMSRVKGRKTRNWCFRRREGVEWSGLTEAVAWPTNGHHAWSEGLRCQTQTATQITAATTTTSSNEPDERCHGKWIPRTMPKKIHIYLYLHTPSRVSTSKTWNKRFFWGVLPYGAARNVQYFLDNRAPKDETLKGFGLTI